MVTPNRNCLQCGTSLSPGEVSCSHCGKQYEPITLDTVQSTSSANQSSLNPSLPQMEPAEFAAPFSSSSPLGGVYGQGSQSRAQTLPLSGEERVPSFSAELPEEFGPQTATLPFAGQFASLLQLRKAPKMGVIIGAILLLCILIGGSFLLLSRGKSNSTGIRSNSAATAKTAKALFSDNFADNSKGWATGSGSGYSSTIGNNQMSLSEANHKILAEPIPASNTSPATFTNFSVTATFTLLKADQNDSVGLYLRGDTDLSQGYFVDIFGDNTYDIVKVFPDSSKDTFLISPTSSSAINAVGQQNKLMVVVKGSSIVLLINDKVVNSITDNSYASGQIALFAENGQTSNGVNATFNSVAIYPAPNQLSTS